MAKTFNENVHNKFAKCEALMIKKQSDYGPKNILNAPIDPRLALVVRLNDKLSRLANLIQNGSEASNESLVDTWMDITNYGLIGWCVEDGTFDLPLKEK